MKRLKLRFSFGIVFLLFFLYKADLNAQTEAEQRARWIFIIAEGTAWEYEEAIDTFSIGVFSSKTEFNALLNLAEVKRVKGKPVKVFLYSEIEDVSNNHIFYIAKKENKYLRNIYEKFRSKNVLIISDRARQAEMSVVNFYPLDQSKKFSINFEFGKFQEFEFSDQLKKLATEPYNSSKPHTEEENRALWIFNIAYGIEWDNEDEFESYSIGVYSSNKEYCALNRLAAVRTIKGKPVIVNHYKNFNTIQNDHIVFITNEKNDSLEFVFEKLKCQNVFIFSDRSKTPEYSFINFNSVNELKKFTFNKELAEQQGLKFLTQKRTLGPYIKGCYDVLLEERENLSQCELELKKLYKEVKKKEKLIEKLEKENKKLKNKLKSL